MKRYVSLFIVLAFGACVDLTNTDYLSGSGPAEITQMSSPGTTTVGKTVFIQIRLSAPNGCWKRLNATLVTVDSKHLRFDGTGAFISNGTCPDGVVLRDTVIKFTPTLAGKIYLQSNLDPYPILKDSLVVTN